MNEKEMMESVIDELARKIAQKDVDIAVLNYKVKTLTNKIESLEQNISECDSMKKYDKEE